MFSAPKRGSSSEVLKSPPTIQLRVPKFAIGMVSISAMCDCSCRVDSCRIRIFSAKITAITFQMTAVNEQQMARAEFVGSKSKTARRRYRACRFPFFGPGADGLQSAGNCDFLGFFLAFAGGKIRADIHLETVQRGDRTSGAGQVADFFQADNVRIQLRDIATHGRRFGEVLRFVLGAGAALETIEGSKMRR